MFIDGNWVEAERLSPKQLLEHGIRRICNTSVYDAKSAIADAPKEVLEAALARERMTSKRASLTKMIEARLRKIEKAAK